MSIRKKILAISIGPVLVLGVITLLFMLTMVKSSLMDEVQDALKGTAAATLAAGGIPRRHPRYFTASMIPAQTASTSSRLRPGCKGSVNSSPCNCSVAGRDGLPPPYSDNKWFGL